MFENLLLAEQTVPNGMVVAIGVGTVFVGLIVIIILCKIMGSLLSAASNAQKAKEAASSAVSHTGTDSKTEPSAVTENRGELLAVISAVIAEELGTDVSAIRIHSFKKL